MDSGGVVTIRADRLLEIADRIKTLESELRQLGLNGLDIKPTTRAPEGQKRKTAPMSIKFDVLNLDWKKSKKSGGGSAGPNDRWAWTFAYPDSDSPDPRTECYELVEALIRYGKVRCGRYIVTLGGRDSRLLNRTLA